MPRDPALRGILLSYEQQSWNGGRWRYLSVAVAGGLERRSAGLMVGSWTPGSSGQCRQSSDRPADDQGWPDADGLRRGTGDDESQWAERETEEEGDAAGQPHVGYESHAENTDSR